MKHTLHRLSKTGVNDAGPGKHSDGGGLWLYKREVKAGRWVYRFTLHGRRHEMGLGPFPDVKLKEARESAEHWRAYVRQGRNPIRQREAERLEAVRNMNRLTDIALDAFESRKAELNGDRKARRWFAPLELHVLPKLGKSRFRKSTNATFATRSRRSAGGGQGQGAARQTTPRPQAHSGDAVAGRVSLLPVSDRRQVFRTGIAPAYPEGVAVEIAAPHPGKSDKR